MFEVGDIVNMKACFSNVSFYTNKLLVVKKVINWDYVLVDNEYNYNTKLWTEYIEINPINNRIKKIRKLKEKFVIYKNN